jgi:aspartate/methionine/tyrosine aminotransferase
MSFPWAASIKAQPMFDVLSRANARESDGHYVARMEIGDTPGFRNDGIHELLSKYVQTPHRYSPSRGEDSLIHSVFESQWPLTSQEDYGVSIAPANFLITAALAALTSPGDTVLVPDPGFPTYKLACDFLGLRILPYPVYPLKVGEFPDLQAFAQEAKVIPKVVIVNNPSNPLGLAIDGHIVKSSLLPLIAMGTEVLIDETYVNLVYDGTDPLIRDIPATRIRSFSKEQCAPGLRMGYALASKTHSSTISDFISMTISCAPKFIQLAVAEYLLTDQSKIFCAEVRSVMSERLLRLQEVVPPNMLLQIPNAAFYAMIHTGNDEESFEFLLNRNVSTCPGSKFGNTAVGALRVSLAGDKSRFESDINMLSVALTEWHSR